MTKRKTKLLRNKRGISPVIATVILVAVVITVAVAVAYWMGGIAARSEKLEIVSAQVVKELWPNQQWIVTIKVKNTGATDATFEGVYVNGKPLSDFSVPITTDAVNVLVESGDEETVHVYIPLALSKSGTTVEVTLHTAAGLDYPQMITLP